VNGLCRCLLLLIALYALAGCGSIKSKLGIGPPHASLRSVSVSADLGANSGSGTQLDIVVVYGSGAVEKLPKTGPEWFRLRMDLKRSLGKDIEIFSVEPVSPEEPFVVDMPRKVRKKGLAVYAFANYVAPEGWPPIALTGYRNASLRLQAKSIEVTGK
jgi:type VI secretion system protein